MSIQIKYDCFNVSIFFSDPNFSLPTGANFGGAPVGHPGMGPMGGPGGGVGMGPQGPIPGGPHPPMGVPMSGGGPMPPHAGGPQPGTAQPLQSNVLGKGTGDRCVFRFHIEQHFPSLVVQS